MGIKDNLINIIRRHCGDSLFGGCTGHGCGAAFNFVTLLADGEVHACHIFPSLIGNIYRQGMAEIYDSDLAHRYRSPAGPAPFAPSVEDVLPVLIATISMSLRTKTLIASWTPVNTKSKVAGKRKRGWLTSGETSSIS
jgi:hypothetical protein